MTNYLVIESRDAFDSRDAGFIAETAVALKESDNAVTVFLVQNGVLAARERARTPYIEELARAGVKVLADDFSLDERGISKKELRSGVEVANVEALVDMLASEETKAFWH